MKDYKRILLLVIIMATVAVTVTTTALGVLYQTAFEEERVRLAETAKSQARLMEAVARFNAQFSQYDHHEGAAEATISQIKNAHGNYEEFGETGEFTLARREGDMIVFILRHRHQEIGDPKPIPFHSSFAEPMRRALLGRSGTMVGPDYRGEMVLAAHEPVAELDLGIVAKIDLAEIRASFIRTGAIVSALAIVVVLAGTVLFFYVGNPMIQALRESERRFRAIFDQTFQLIALLKTDGTVLEANTSALDLAGVKLSDVVGKPFWDTAWWAHSKEQQIQIREAVKEAARGIFVRMERTLQARDGRVVDLDFSLKPVKDDKGNVVLLIPEGWDITERKRAENALKERSSHMRGILDNVFNGIVTIDEHGLIDSFNPAAERMFGYSSDEVIGQNVKLLMTDSDAVRHDEYIRNYLQTGEGKIIGVAPREVTGRRKCGEEFPVDLVVSELRLKERTLFIGVLGDMTQRKSTERQLQRALKMEAVGNLTGGIAHDFNNILGIILGNLQLLKRRMKDDERLQSLFETAIDATHHGADLTKRLLAFSRRQELDPEVLDVNVLVDDMDKMLRRTLGEHIEIETALADGLYHVKADPTQLESALLNLAINARHAMPRGGRLMIETSNIELDNSYVAEHPDAKTGPHVCVSVTDTGAGIPEEIRERIFEPFFTTKEVGEGSGLGLSMVYGFVKQSGGHINVYSEEGRGARLRIYLPRTDEGAAAVEAEEASADDLPRGAETVLLVEDDERFRRTAALLLEDLGYTVVDMSDGPSALKALEAHPDIDILFTDMIMPGGMNGHELAQRAQELRPGLPVLLASGYPRDAFSEGRQFPLLSKPYTDMDLARTVRAVLDERQEPEK